MTFWTEFAFHIRTVFTSCEEESKGAHDGVENFPHCQIIKLLAMKNSVNESNEKMLLLYSLPSQSCQQFRIAEPSADCEQGKDDVDRQCVHKCKTMRDVRGESSAVVADDQDKSDSRRAWEQIE